MFMSMRRAASCGQPRADRERPLGDLTSLGPPLDC